MLEQGLAPSAAQAITQLSMLGAGAATGGAPAAVAAFNEATNNAAMAIPLIVEAVIEGGVLAARACLSSPICLNALRLGGAVLVAKEASMLSPQELAAIPGFGNSQPLPPPAPLVTPADPQSGPTTTAGNQLDQPQQSTTTGGNQITEPAPGDNIIATPIHGPQGPNILMSEGSYDPRLPIAEPTTGKNGLPVMSNPKHTPGVSGWDSTSGTEPRNSLDLFNQLIPSPTNPEERFSIDANGNIHRFKADNNGVFHWNGGSGDAKDPLRPERIPVAIRRLPGVKL